MDSTPLGRMTRIIALLVTLAATQAHAVPGGTQRVDTSGNRSSRGSDSEERVYIVQFSEAAALADSAGRFDPTDKRAQRRAARQRARELEQRQNELLSSLGVQQKRIYAYKYTFNGAALRLTRREAEKLRQRKGVVNVWEDRRRRVSSNFSANFLGLNSPESGLRAREGLRGKDIIIGVIDSGITPNHPSFSEREEERKKPGLCRSSWAEASLLGRWLCRRFDKPGNLLFSDIPAGWQGECESGQNFPADACNNKLIGARFFNEGFLLGGPTDPNEFVSPADADGHGSHIASIAAGNQVKAQIFGREIGNIAGIAPQARVAAYKACWLEPGGFRATCSVIDLLAAIDAAVDDGVDIINYSVGSADDSLTDPDDLALLRAADLGILSVVASGNDGPGNFTMLAPATTPWVLSVGASTRTGTRVAEATRVNRPEAVARDYETKEASFTPRLAERGPITGTLALVNDGDILTPDGEIGTVFDGCTALLNGDEVSGNIAYIQRGGCDFDTKISNAQEAGAVAVLVFSNDQALQVMAGDATGITIPALMIGQADGQLLRDRLAEEEVVEVTLDKSIFIDLAETGNVMGTFSGRGPSLADSDFLKPDVVAPGVQILGAQTPSVANGFRGELYQYLSGTSQSSPQVAGIAALLKEARPDWSPAALKSALMTSARQDIRKTVEGDPADPFDIGAGHVVPNAALNPGLVYDTTTEEYDAYLCTVGLARLTADECDALMAQGFNLDARDINLPSVAITELVNEVTVTRRVRNVGPPGTYTVEIDTPAGIELVVEPQRLTLGEDEEAEFTLTFSSSAESDWRFGSYTWVSGDVRVRSPFAVQATTILFPEELLSLGNAGNATFDVEFGYTGAYAAIPFGLSLPCVLPDNTPDDGICTNTSPATIVDDPFNSYVFSDEPPIGVVRFFVDLEDPDLPFSDDERPFYFRAALYDELTDGNDDLDLYVYYCEDQNRDDVCEAVAEVGSSQRDGSSLELVDDVQVRPRGVYIIDVHAFETDRTVNGSAAQFCLYTWGFDRRSSTNFALSGAPPGAVAGTTATLGAAWTGLDDGLWLGGVLHESLEDNPPNARVALGSTLLEVDVNALPVQTPGSFVCP